MSGDIRRDDDSGSRTAFNRPMALTIPVHIEEPSRAGTAVLRCDTLFKKLDDRVVVQGISFEVGEGEAYGLLGPNGAGKTTTIRLVCGILAPDAGTIRTRLTSASGHNESPLGYVPQDVALFPMLTLSENMRFWAKLGGVPRRERSARVTEALETVGLAGRANDQLHTCSGGMQRRANLAVALLTHPKLLVLDEPTVGVDPQSRSALLNVLARLKSDGTAILYSSHYMDEVHRLCDRIGIVDHGQMLIEGAPDDLLARHHVPDLETLFLELTGRELRD